MNADNTRLNSIVDLTDIYQLVKQLISLKCQGELIVMPTERVVTGKRTPNLHSV